MSVALAWVSSEPSAMAKPAKTIMKSNIRYKIKKIKIFGQVFA